LFKEHEQSLVEFEFSLPVALVDYDFVMNFRARSLDMCTTLFRERALTKTKLRHASLAPCALVCLLGCLVCVLAAAAVEAAATAAAEIIIAASGAGERWFPASVSEGNATRKCGQVNISMRQGCL